ncbi:MAG: biotin/lipoyl-binding protein [Bacteroidaceae bacterium]|nr:biotin/lipoyl-binding protein [Bacteroidaceae bacterium]
MKQYNYKINGIDYEVTIHGIKGQIATLEVNGMPFNVEIVGSTLSEEDLPTMGAATTAATTPTAAPAPAAAAPSTKGAAGSGTPVKAPLPGVVTKVLVGDGQHVKKGDVVLVLEAMKMENNITAECDGKVTGICCEAGDSVMEGTTLITIG